MTTHYDSFATNLVRDQANWHPDWEGELPPVMTREQLKAQMEAAFRERGGFSDAQVEKALDFFVQYEERYHEAPGGKTYHRACGGGAMNMVTGSPICRRCGQLPDLLPPAFLRR